MLSAVEYYYAGKFIFTSRNKPNYLKKIKYEHPVQWICIFYSLFFAWKDVCTCITCKLFMQYTKLCFTFRKFVLIIMYIVPATLIIYISGRENLVVWRTLVVHCFAWRSPFTKIHSWKLKRLRLIKSSIYLIAPIRILEYSDKYFCIYDSKK